MGKGLQRRRVDGSLRIQCIRRGDKQHSIKIQISCSLTVALASLSITHEPRGYYDVGHSFIMLNGWTAVMGV